MNNIKKILIIIQRSNGDVFLSSPLINALYKNYNHPKIDLLVNDDTLAIAKTLDNISYIHTFSYKDKKNNRWQQEKRIIKTIYKKYDLSINLTASDRSVLYAILSSKKSISVIESDGKKSWWKKHLLYKYYCFNTDKSIVINNIQSLKFLNIEVKNIIIKANYFKDCKSIIVEKLRKLKIAKFIIFHPSAQYQYKIYPQELRNKLLELLSTLNVSIVVTGGKNKIDLQVKNNLPKLPGIYDFIGNTSLEEYIALSDLSSGYIGMDTLNMHIAAAQNKSIFAIFGPTLLKTWSPWSNILQKNANTNLKQQTYGNITLFQADMPCVACGLAGCDDRHGISECLDKIDFNDIFSEVKRQLLEQ